MQDTAGHGRPTSGLRGEDLEDSCAALFQIALSRHCPRCNRGLFEEVTRRAEVADPVCAGCGDVTRSPRFGAPSAPLTSDASGRIALLIPPFPAPPASFLLCPPLAPLKENAGRT